LRIQDCQTSNYLLICTALRLPRTSPRPNGTNCHRASVLSALRTDIVDDPQYLGDWVKEHPLVRPNLEQLSRLTPISSMPGPNYRQIDRTMMAAVEQAVYGDRDPVKVMTDAQTRATALMPP
jgi:hypothetical protein